MGEAKDLWMVEVTRVTLGGSVTARYVADVSGTVEGVLHAANVCGKVLEKVCHLARWDEQPRPHEVKVTVLRPLGLRKWMPVAQMSAFLGESEYADHTGKVIGRPDREVHLYWCEDRS